MPTWTTDISNAVVTYWNDLGYDKDQIADALNFEYPDCGPFTGAVVHRKIEAMRRGGKVFKSRTVSVRVRTRNRPQTTSEPVVMKTPINVKSEQLTGVLFAEATRSQCQWIEGDVTPNKPTMVCGKPVVSGKPYCSEHCKRAYQPPAIRGTKRDDKHA